MGDQKYYHPMMKTVQDSARRIPERTTQYINHGVSWEGSVDRIALYDAKAGKRIVMIELEFPYVSLASSC